MHTALGFLPVVLLVVGFEVYCVVQLTGHDAKILPRWAWAVCLVASIPLGGILYLLLGRGAATDRSSSTAAGPSDALGPLPDVASSAPAPPITGRPMVSIDRLTKQYGSELALDQVSLEVPHRSVFGIVGPNGAGKTTLLSILAGLRSPTSGAVELDVPSTRVALLPDTPSFEPWLTAREVVDLARDLSARSGPVATTMEALGQAGLAEAADRRTEGFSRGMLQRLGLAATIVGQPDLLLLDEPCSALDPVGRREVLDLVARLGTQRTVVFCSHILDDVQEVCDTVGILRRGRVLYQGGIEDLLVGRAAPEYLLRVRAPVQPVVDALDREPWVAGVEQVGAEVLRVRVTSRDDAEARLPATLAASGARLVSAVPSGADLEQVFLELVR